MSLAVRTLKAAALGLLVLGFIIFVPVGTLVYWQGWIFIIVFTISTNIIGIYLALKDPELLKRRMKAGPGAEPRPAQKVLITLAFSGMIGLIIFSVFDHRFGWSHVPVWVSLLGNILVTLGLMIDLLVFRENSYGASTIEKMEGQEGDIHRPLRHCAASDVRGGADHAHRRAAGAGFLLGSTVHAA